MATFCDKTQKSRAPFLLPNARTRKHQSLADRTRSSVWPSSYSALPVAQEGVPKVRVSGVVSFW